MALGLLLSLVPSMGWGQLEGVRFADFSGGINDNTDPTKISQTESPDAQNMVVDLGGLRPRKGITHCGVLPSGNAGKSIFNYSKSDGSEKIIASDNENYYETADCSTWTRFRDGEPTNSIADYAIVRNKLWVVNRSTHAFTWDGSTTTLLDGGTNEPNPAPPRCSYINFWKERVFMGRCSSYPSGIAFSDVTDSAGSDLDPSTGTAAWPATNVIQVGEESEGPIYGMHIYRDRLYAFKESSIYKINFNSRFDISVEKTAQNVGTRYDKTIQEIDGLLYFAGPLGVYAFDGDRVVRISEKIDSRFSSLRQPNNDESFKNWSVADDFDDGTLIQISTVQIAGSIEIENPLTEDWGDGEQLGDIGDTYPWTEHDTVAAVIVSENTVDGGHWLEFKPTGPGQTLAVASSTPAYRTIHQSGLQFDLDIVEGSNSVALFKAFFMNHSDQHEYGRETGYFVLMHFTAPEVGIYRTTGGTDVLIASTTPNNTHTDLEKEWQITWDASGDISVSTDGVKFLSGNDTTYSTVTSMGFAFRADVSASPPQSGHQVRIDNIEVQEATGSWISDKFNAVTVSSWTAFETTQNENGGTLEWQYRAATSEANLDSASWASIEPGVTPNIANTNTWIQFQSSFTAKSDNYGRTPEVLDVTQNFSQGDFVSQPMYSGYVDKRYWVTATSGTETNNNIVMVRSREHEKNAWMFYDLEIGDITEFNDKWYALASTHSAVYRLEDGENDNGKGIVWYWETSDAEWGAPWMRKELLRGSVEYRADDAANAKFGWSKDSGASFTERTLNMSGTGRNSKTYYINGGNAYDFRFRVFNDTLDEDAVILGITGWAYKRKVMD